MQIHLEKLSGIVEKVTYHNETNGWSVLKLSSFNNDSPITVIVHQAKVFAGATMEFWGSWGNHPKYGEQFKASQAIEKKPASVAALEKYIGSGLIKGVGPHIAKRIVSHFKGRTLEVFESSIEELQHIPGIAKKKLAQIKASWEEHRSIRDVMIFLQNYGISTLFATKIFKTYGDKAIAIVSENPYRLAQDIYGIGFFSADQIALSMGFERQGIPRIESGIKHILASSRNEGHCYLTEKQITLESQKILNEKIDAQKIRDILQSLLDSQQIKLRRLKLKETKTTSRTDEASSQPVNCFYSKSLFFDELHTAQIIKKFAKGSLSLNEKKIRSWVSRYCQENNLTLSDEQEEAVCRIPTKKFSILTGGPGCGKTTCTRVLVALLQNMKLNVTLSAPTGRAAQRMTEVIGMESKTIHRLLEWAPGGFKRDEKNQIQSDFLILDESSMIDISLAASLLKATPSSAQILFIGDPDQLPPVGAGQVLADLLKSNLVPRFRLTKIFRQAKESSIIRFAHNINSGEVPKIISPLKVHDAYKLKHDCLFLDADEATQEQLKLIRQVKQITHSITKENPEYLIKFKDEWGGKVTQSQEGHIDIDKLYRPHVEKDEDIRAPVIQIPDKFRHANLEQIANSPSKTAQLSAVLKSIHPWSSLRLGLTALDTVIRVYTHSIKKWIGSDIEIQLLTPQVRGTLGTLNLNESLQKVCNPESPHKPQLQLGRKTLRTGDRVIQTKNNYDLGVFNGDIGKIMDINTEDGSCIVLFSGGSENRTIQFKREDLNEVQLAYAITIHKSQGSEFEAVIIPVVGQHFNMLYRNLIYTGLTRAKKIAVFVGSRKALTMAVNQIDNRKRQTLLPLLIETPHL